MQPDFDRSWEKACLAAGDDLHDLRGQFSLQQIHERADPPGAVGFQSFPRDLFYRFNFDRDPVKSAPTHQRIDDAWGDLKIYYRAIPHVSAPAREPVFIITVGFQIFAPGFAPETPGNRPPVDADRVQFLPFLLEGICRFLRASAFFGCAHIRPEAPSPAHKIGRLKSLLHGALEVKGYEPQQFVVWHLC